MNPFQVLMHIVNELSVFVIPKIILTCQVAFILCVKYNILII